MDSSQLHESTKLDRLRLHLEELQGHYIGKRPTIPFKEFAAELQRLNRHLAEMRGELFAISPSWYEDVATLKQIEQRLDLIDSVASLYGFVARQILASWTKEILNSIPPFTPSGKFPFCSFLEMNHVFFYLTNHEQLQVRAAGNEAFIYHPNPERLERYRIPASGRWVSIPTLKPTLCQDAEQVFYWSAQGLFENRYRLELRIAAKADTLPPRPMDEANPETLIDEINQALEVSL